MGLGREIAGVCPRITAWLKRVSQEEIAGFKHD